MQCNNLLLLLAFLAFVPRILEQYPPNAMKDLLDTLVTNTKDLMVDPFGSCGEDVLFGWAA